MRPAPAQRDERNHQRLGYQARGVRALAAKPTIEDVTIDVQGSGESYGVSSVSEGADPIIEPTKIRVTTATNGHGSSPSTWRT